MLIYSIDGQIVLPKPGFYAIKFRKGLRERALGVQRRDGHWLVFLDGAPITQSSTRWEDAFGFIYDRCQPLAGRRLAGVEYRNLVQARARDVFDGVDLWQPINPHTERVAI